MQSAPDLQRAQRVQTKYRRSPNEVMKGRVETREGDSGSRGGSRVGGACMHFVVGSMGRIGVEEEEGGSKPDSDDASGGANPAADGQRRRFCTLALSRHDSAGRAGGDLDHMLYFVLSQAPRSVSDPR